MTTTPAFRVYQETDRAWFVALFTDEAVMRHVDGPLEPALADQLFDRVLEASQHPGAVDGRVHTAWVVEEDGPVAHAAVLREGDELEIGYILAQAAWGRGLGTAVARALVARGFAETDAPHLIATVDADHPASIRVLEKAGLTLRTRIEDEDGAYDVYEIQR